ncbi:MAG TPA: Wzz/FepE/Etk N-terminal domain-containing protein [Candidatus Koribacter sp.]|jgi:capsule polysaccharide export protein KpsE/RkpR
MPLTDDSIAAPEVVKRVWLARSAVAWRHRRTVYIAAACGLVLSATIAFLLPKQYESSARIMPPQDGISSAVMAAIVGRSLPGNLGAFAGNLLGARNSSDLYMDLLKSRTIRERLADHFGLQKLYKNRYREDTLKRLGHRTEITEDHKTGVITVTVTDTDPRRAHDMTQAYLDELNTIVARVHTSAAGRERQFIEQRLVTVKVDLDEAQRQLSAFSSKNVTLDVKEQTRVMVEATARMEGELILARTELSSLDQIYGPENVRVRATEARIAKLQDELRRATGSAGNVEVSQDAPYPSLRSIPSLGVQWTDLYRRVKIQETVYEMLTQEYEVARIEEARSMPTVGVIDTPNYPERKSFPPRLIMMLAGTLIFAAGGFFVVVRRAEWHELNDADPRKHLVKAIVHDLKTQDMHWLARRIVQRNGHREEQP